MFPQRLSYQGIPEIIGGEYVDRYHHIESVYEASKAYISEETILNSNPVERYILQTVRENCITARHWLGHAIPRQDAVIMGQVSSSHERRDVRIARAGEKADHWREQIYGIKAEKPQRAKWWKQLRSEWVK